MKQHHKGFTLIELMIVVAIVAILGSLAYPSYRDSVLKGKRAEARTALMELMQQQERYMTQRNAYLEFSNAGGTTTTPANAKDVFKIYSGNSLGNAAYLLQADRCDAPNDKINECVKLTAKPRGSDPAVGDLWLTSTGQKGCTTNSAACWK